MKTKVSLSLIAMLAASSFAADSKDAVASAAGKLAARDNYGWTTTIVVPEGTRFRPGPTHGKTQKNGATVVEMTFGDNTTRAVIQGDKAAVTNRDGDWESVEDLENAEGGGRFRAMIVKNIMVPSEEAMAIVKDAKGLKQDGDVISGELTEQGARSLIAFRRRGGGEGGPEITGAKGSVKFWVKDGELVKYEYQVEGTMRFNDNDVEMNRVTTVQIKDVGTTKVEIPEGAKKKLS
jgi:hypothetical protein